MADGRATPTRLADLGADTIANRQGLLLLTRAGVSMGTRSFCVMTQVSRELTYSPHLKMASGFDVLPSERSVRISPFFDEEKHDGGTSTDPQWLPG
jgi:hypothetical protein